MQVLEFSTHVQNGIITLPAAYRHLNSKIKIRLEYEDEQDLMTIKEEKLLKKKLFLEALEGLKEVKSMSDIEDAMAWQRAQRDEWE